MSETRLPLVAEDSWLEPYEKVLNYRVMRYRHALDLMPQGAQRVRAFASCQQYLGAVLVEGQWVFSEWLPGAREVSLIGEFNDWTVGAHPLTRDADGVWHTVVPASVIRAGQGYKLHIVGQDGSARDRLPALAMQTRQDAETHDFCAVVAAPSDYVWKSAGHRDLQGQAPLIYEAHVGIAGEDGRVHSYREFADAVLPRIIAGGYNTLQLMAVAEHPYYGSFGYHVSNYYAPSSRFGTPDDLRYLVDCAHEAGLVVLMDIVHSHGVKNMAEGLNDLDGSGALYFHAGERGDHPQWDSKCFDYGREEVQRFLLSNLRYWMEEFRIDGFRFDGVTSMLYWHRGMQGFDSLEEYFSRQVDNDAILYLQLATTLVREIHPDALIIAEDMSGMPGLCRPVEDGGIGFTHRLAMGVPDYWIRTLKERRDEDWDLSELWHMLQNRRAGEAHIAYAESHDQALVGDKTLAFRLMDQEMYWHMSRDQAHPLIERGMALHKMIRLLTMAAGGEGFLTFMGNEFGHPEWLDFPREGNDWSYHYARRQWSLVDDPALRYGQLAAFERAFLQLQTDYGFLSGETTCLRLDPAGRVLAFSRGALLFVLNFSVDTSYEGSEVYLPAPGSWQVILDSDAHEFGGHGRLDPSVTHHTTGDPPRLQLYLPHRTILVLREE